MNRDKERAAEYQREYLKDPANKKKHAQNTANWREKNKDRSRADSLSYYYLHREERANYYLLKKYGITLEEHARMLAAQGGRCANPGCRADNPGGHGGRFPVDHDHDTGKIRELLCHGCNTGVGSLSHSIAKLEGMIMYLRKHGKT
jgi:hypothetical protein